MTPSPEADNKTRQTWEKECLDTFFVYNMKRGKHGDHVGAQDELIDFIRQAIATAIQEERKKFARILLKIGNSSLNDAPSAINEYIDNLLDPRHP